MARFRLQNPGNYRSGDRVSAEFENLARYLVAAERGDKTLGELTAMIFGTDGEIVDSFIEMRYDATDGLQYRIGEYDDALEGWVNIATPEMLTGPAGDDVGELLGPIMADRTDITATSGQMVFPYEFDDADDVLVFRNGLLVAEALYTKDGDADTVTFLSGVTLNHIITIIKIRAQAVSNYDRSEAVASASQVIFPFTHTDEQTILVFKNGILQKSGGSNDYVLDDDNDTITFTTPCSASDAITAITVEDNSVRAVTGLMTTDRWVESGYIPFNRINVQDAEIAQEKIDGLAALLADRGRIYFQASEPDGPQGSDLWVDTSSSPNALKFFNGVSWLATTSLAVLPDIDVAKALYVVRLNGSGTAYELALVDLSTVIPYTEIGVADGVAGLDADAYVPDDNIPEHVKRDTIWYELLGANANATYNITRLFRQKVRVDAITFKLTSGTATIQLAVDGVTVGSTSAATSALGTTTLSPTITVDATSVAKLVQVVVSAGSSPVDLSLGLHVTKLEA